MEDEDLTAKQNENVQQPNPTNGMAGQELSTTGPQQPIRAIAQPQTPINQPPLQQENHSTGSKWIWIVIIIIVLTIGGYFVFNSLKDSDTNNITSTSTTAVKSGLKTVTGCVKPLGTNIEINFQLGIPDDFVEYNPTGEQSCAGSKNSNEIGYRIPGHTTTITVDVFIAAGSSELSDFDKKTTTRFPVPVPNDKYMISLNRDNINSTADLSNDQWSEISQSLSLK